MILRYLQRRWRRFSHLWRPHPTSTIPYFVVRDHVEAGFERRGLLIDTVVDTAIIMAIGIALDPKLRQPPLWAVIVGSILTYLIFVGISFTTSVTADVMSFMDESQRVEACVAFLGQKAYSRKTIDDIAALAAMNSSSVQNRLPLPTVILTVIATIVVIQQFSPGIWFILGMMALLSLLSFAMTTGEAHADLIVQKAIVITQREDDQRKQQIKNERLIEALLTRPVTPTSSIQHASSPNGSTTSRGAP